MSARFSSKATVLFALLVATACSPATAHQTSRFTSTTPTPVGSAPLLAQAPPPWLPPFFHGGANNILAAGLPLLSQEALTVHYHAHLDVIVDSATVEVPAYLGFAQVNGQIALSTLHTHDASGIIHIEAPAAVSYTLGQLFTEWGVRFTQQCIGSLCTGNGKQLAVFVDGHPYAGDITHVVFTRHEEIAVEFGDRGRLPAPPSSYAFPPGL